MKRKRFSFAERETNGDAVETLQKRKKDALNSAHPQHLSKT